MISINVALLWSCVQLSWAGTRGDPRLGSVCPGGALQLWSWLLTCDQILAVWVYFGDKNAMRWMLVLCPCSMGMACSYDHVELLWWSIDLYLLVLDLCRSKWSLSKFTCTTTILLTQICCLCCLNWHLPNLNQLGFRSVKIDFFENLLLLKSKNAELTKVI